MPVQITIRGVPEAVRDELAARAALQRQSMQEFLRGELERIASRPSVSDWLLAVRERKALAGPELALAEASNILRRLELAGQVSHLAAASAHADLLRLDVALFPFAPFAERIWALRKNLSSYDAWYVALAETLDCPLATLDRRLSHASGPLCTVLTPHRPHD